MLQGARTGSRSFAKRLSKACFALLAGSIVACGSAEPTYDYVLRGGALYDGSGRAAVEGDVAITDDRIVAIGEVPDTGHVEFDVTGLAVAPGFVNMLSWANESLLEDGRSMSDIVQGVTLEVMGEGVSMGPWTDAMAAARRERQGEIQYEIPWRSLGGYLEHLEDRGVSTNVASLVGATTLRTYAVGYEDRPATPEELAEMERLAHDAMLEGALGVGSSLPYTPAVFASTDELTALASVAAEYGGMYLSHIRNEGDTIHEALDEFLRIARDSGARSEVYHLKASQKQNWHKLDEVVERLEQARREGLEVGADIYPYHASATGLSINFPAWVKEGGHERFVERLQEPEVRARLQQEMEMIPPGDIKLTSFRSDALRHLTGQTLAEVAESWGVTAEVAAMDLIVRDDSGVGTVRFTMSEENIRKKIALPWVTFCSDGGSIAPEPPFTSALPHPRSYGTFARILGKYVREEGLISMEEAIHRLTALPVENLGIVDRGRLERGYFADIVVFDPESIQDRATFEDPHQLATGVEHVFVNGVPVIERGEHTGATPGRFVRGPGWSGRESTPEGAGDR